MKNLFKKLYAAMEMAGRARAAAHLAKLGYATKANDLM